MAAQLIAIDADALGQVLQRLDSLERKLDRVSIKPPPRWISVQEYAGQVGKTVQTVRKWAKQGRVETHKGMYRNPEA